jgi:hypothetical protein
MLQRPFNMLQKEQQANIKAILIEGPNTTYSSIKGYEKVPGVLVIEATSSEQVIKEIARVKDKIQPNVRIDLDCHGIVNNDKEHVIGLDESCSISTKTFFEQLTKVLPDKPIHMQAWSCYSGALTTGEIGNYVRFLPKGSTLIAHSGKNDASLKLMSLFAIKHDLKKIGSQDSALSLEEQINYFIEQLPYYLAHSVSFTMNVGGDKANPVFYAKSLNESSGRKDPLSFKADTYNTWAKVQGARFVDEFLPKELNPRLTQEVKVTSSAKSLTKLDEKEQLVISLLLSTYLTSNLKTASIKNFGGIKKALELVNKFGSDDQLVTLFNLSEQDIENAKKRGQEKLIQNDIALYVKGLKLPELEAKVLEIILQGIFRLNKSSKQIHKFLSLAIEEGLIKDLSLLFGYPGFHEIERDQIDYLKQVITTCIQPERLPEIITKLSQQHDPSNSEIYQLFFSIFAAQDNWILANKCFELLGHKAVNLMIGFLEKQSRNGKSSFVLRYLEDSSIGAFKEQLKGGNYDKLVVALLKQEGSDKAKIKEVMLKIGVNLKSIYFTKVLDEIDLDDLEELYRNYYEYLNDVDVILIMQRYIKESKIDKIAPIFEIYEKSKSILEVSALIYRCCEKSILEQFPIPTLLKLFDSQNIPVVKGMLITALALNVDKLAKGIDIDNIILTIKLLSENGQTQKVNEFTKNHPEVVKKMTERYMETVFNKKKSKYVATQEIVPQMTMLSISKKPSSTYVEDLKNEATKNQHML